MGKHEIKYCPRCNAAFECKVETILLCQCATVKLTEEEREYINKKFYDCLCASCMQDLKIEYHNNKLR